MLGLARITVWRLGHLEAIACDVAFHLHRGTLVQRNLSLLAAAPLVSEAVANLSRPGKPRDHLPGDRQILPFVDPILSTVELIVGLRAVRAAAVELGIDGRRLRRFFEHLYSGSRRAADREEPTAAKQDAEQSDRTHAVRSPSLLYFSA